MGLASPFLRSSSLLILDVSFRKVMERFGKFHSILEPGLNLAIPIVVSCMDMLLGDCAHATAADSWLVLSADNIGAQQFFNCVCLLTCRTELRTRILSRKRR